MSTTQFFDVHTHTQFSAFVEDQDAVIRRALDSDVWLVNVGTQKDTSEKAIEIAQRYSEGVFATVGLHPIHTEKSHHDSQELGDTREAKGFTSRGEEFDYDYYKTLAQDQKVVAIGECGLDYYRITKHESRSIQEKAFRAQIELAGELKKPLMIHCRNAFDDLIKFLNSCFVIRTSRKPGIIHFFTGAKEDAQKLLDMGFSFSFGGVITFARDYDEVIQYIPIDRIVLETDAPYVAPMPYRGKRNEPSYITEIAKRMGELKNISFEEIHVQTFRNALKIFCI